MSRLPNNMRRAEVPAFVGEAPADALEGEIVDEETVTLVINGEPLPVTVTAEKDPDNPRLAHLRLEEKEPSEIYPDGDELPDDNIDVLLGQFAVVEVPTRDREILADLGDLAASEMMGGMVLGVQDRRMVEPPEYEPSTSSYIPEIRMDITGSPEAVLRKFELDQS